MDAHQVAGVGPLGARMAEHQVLVPLDERGAGGEVAEGRGQRDRVGQLDPVVDAAPAGQVVDGDQRQAVFRGEDAQRVKPHHLAVVVGDFTDHSDRGQSGGAAQVHRGFGVAAAFEHSPRGGAQREDVPGADQLLRGGLRVGQQPAGQRAVRRRDAGADAAGRVAADGEGSALGVLVDADHRGQAQRVGAGGVQRHADHPGGVPDGEGHELRGGVLGGEDDVALVLAVFVVDDHHGAAGGQRCQGGGN